MKPAAYLFDLDGNLAVFGVPAVAAYRADDYRAVIRAMRDELKT